MAPMIIGSGTGLSLTGDIVLVGGLELVMLLELLVLSLVRLVGCTVEGLGPGEGNAEQRVSSFQKFTHYQVRIPFQIFLDNWLGHTLLWY